MTDDMSPQRLHIPTRIEELPNSKPRFLSHEVPQVEDRDHVTGKTDFADNVTLPGMLHSAILRSPFAHGRIKAIDVSEALKLPGVAAVITGEDAKRWSQPLGSMPLGWAGYAIATDKVRFVGEPVAAVAAVNRYVAEDALELINVEYEPLEPIIDPVKALEPGSPLVFEDKGTNVMFHKDYKWGEVDQAFVEADHVFTEKFRWNPMAANTLEGNVTISTWDVLEGTVTCEGSFQIPSSMVMGVSAMFGVPPNNVCIKTHPCGASFGGKGSPRHMPITILLSRKAGGAPVKHVDDRMEYLLAGNHAWDRHYEASIALKSDGRITGLQVNLVDDLAASGEGMAAFQPLKPLSCFTGCYAIPVAGYDITMVATNKVPQAVYRGAGPPPHYFVLEQIVDIAARGIGMDPAEIRRKNFVQPDQFPYTIPSGNEYDSGDYELALDTVLEMADYQALRQEQDKARAEGRLVGIGVANVVEPGVFDFNNYADAGMPLIGIPEGVTIAMDMAGGVRLQLGHMPIGQRHWSTATMVVADYFGIPMESVRIVYQDSLSAPPCFGPGGSRLGVAMTGGILGACSLLKEKLIKVAAPLLQAKREDVELMDGMLRVKAMPQAAMPMTQVVATMLCRSDLLPPDVDMNPTATYAWTAAGRMPPDDMGRCKSYLTAANACHVVSVEIDPETGKTKILKYFVADDCGTRLNPTSVEGMTDGGIGQGVGAALFEEYLYSEDGQPLSNTFMEYLLPTIHDIPEIEKKALVTPSPVAPLGAKGCGEGAMHIAPAAVMNAVNDALVPLDVRATEVPASPRRLWQLIQKARQDQKPGADGQ